MFGGFGMGELLILGAIVLLLFGKRLPKLMRSVGATLPAFRQGMTQGDEAAA